MTEPLKPRKFYIPTVRAGSKSVVCPICGHDEFLSITPDLELAKQEGFRHVVMGVFGEDRLSALVVRFQHCANCGYILNCVLGNLPEGETT